MTSNGEAAGAEDTAKGAWSVPPGDAGLRCHLDGELVPIEDAGVSVLDRGFRYGDAAFETLRAYGGTVFEWAAHAERLERTCAGLQLEHGIDREDFHARIEETLAANDLADAYVRLSVTRGIQAGTLAPDPAIDPTVVVLVRPLPRGGLEGESTWDDPATVATVQTRRVPGTAIPAHLKTHSYLNGVLARLEVPDADEVLLREVPGAHASDRIPDGAGAIAEDAGAIAEGSVSNVFAVRDSTLVTPSLEGSVLPGITRRVVLELAADAGIPVAERSLTLRDLRTAEECFLTNTTWEIRPVGELDGRSFEVGPVTERLARRFDEHVERTCY